MASAGPVDLSKAIDYSALKGRNVLLTGGASGLGKDMVAMLVKNGANVVFGDLNVGAGKQVEQDLVGKGGKIKFVHVDVTSFESQVALVREALAFYPRGDIDIFIPCAGILSLPTQVAPADPAELANLRAPPADLKANIINVNLAGVYVGTLLVARYGMGLHKESKPRPTKSIVLIASLAGYCGVEGSVEYTTSKYGVRGLLRGLRKQLSSLGVRLNAVAPFYIETPMTEFAIPALKEMGIPVATSEQVTEVVARLATDEKAFGRSISIMPDSILDLGDDAVGKEGGGTFSVASYGEHWKALFEGPMSDNVPAEAVSS